MLPRIAPFVVYMLFLAVESGTSWVASYAPTFGQWRGVDSLWLYPVKTAAVAGVLLWFWRSYSELRDSIVLPVRDLGLAVVVGLVAYVLWVRMDWAWATLGQSAGYEPFRAGPGAGVALAAIRLFGAAVVVPIMEELFWRSFLIRFLVNPDFEKVRLGSFTLLSFAATVGLFGLEHTLWLAGMMAGLAYNLLLYQTGRLWPCIVAHGVTNLALGLHVLITGEWHWW